MLMHQRHKNIEILAFIVSGLLQATVSASATTISLITHEELPVFIHVNNLSASRQPHWIPYFENAAIVSYIDINSIQTIGQMQRYRTALNFRRRAGQAASSITYREMNCFTQELRWSTTTSYTEPFGQGKIVGVMTPEHLGGNRSKFLPVDSENESVSAEYRFVCQKSK